MYCNKSPNLFLFQQGLPPGYYQIQMLPCFQTDRFRCLDQLYIWVADAKTLPIQQDMIKTNGFAIPSVFIEKKGNCYQYMASNQHMGCPGWLLFTKGPNSITHQLSADHSDHMQPLLCFMSQPHVPFILYGGGCNKSQAISCLHTDDDIIIIESISHVYFEQHVWASYHGVRSTETKSSKAQTWKQALNQDWIKSCPEMYFYSRERAISSIWDKNDSAQTSATCWHSKPSIPTAKVECKSNVHGSDKTSNPSIE